MLYRVVKTLNTTTVILNAAPELQAAFVAEVVEIYCKLGTPKRRIREWFRDNSVPNASAEIVRLLLRRQLPFTDDDLSGMFEKLSGISFLGFVEFREQMAQALQKYARNNDISRRLRKAAANYGDVLVIKRVSRKEAALYKDEYGFPSSTDLKTTARINEILGR